MNISGRTEFEPRHLLIRFIALGIYNKIISSETYGRESLTTTTSLNLIGMGHSRLRDLILSGKASRAKITISLEDGTEETFSGKCQLTPASLLNRANTVADIIEDPPSFDKSPKKSSVSTFPIPTPVSTPVSSMAVSAIGLESLKSRLTSLNQAVAKNNLPFRITPTVDSSLIKPMLPTFHINDVVSTANEPIRTPSPKIGLIADPISPQSSPEIIVDKLTPEMACHDERRNVAEDPTATSAATPLTPTRPRGPKKNFLARQAALDKKLDVLRQKAEQKSEETNGVVGEKIQLEMSDSEFIEGHVAAASP